MCELTDLTTHDIISTEVKKMKKMISTFLCIIFCGYLLCGCSVHKKNVVYFGYFNGDEKNQSGEYYTEELSQTNHANIVFVSNNDAVTEAWKNRLEMVLNFPEEVFSTQEDGSLYLSNFWKARYRQYALPLLGDYLTGICLDHPYSRGLSAEDLKLLAKTLQTDSAKSKLVIWENAEKIPELNQYLANLYEDEALEEHVILMAEFSQTPTHAQIREVTQAAQSIPVWIKVPNSSVSEVYNMAIDVQGIIAENAGEISDDHLQIGQEILLEYPRPGNANSNLAYFGYYHAAGYAKSEDFFDEIGAMQNSNLAMIETFHSQLSAEEAIKKSMENNLAPVLNFGDILKWQTDENGDAHIVDNWEEIYAAFQASIENCKDDIFAFYQDEPAWNGIPEDIFRYCTQRLRQDYPNIRIMTCVAVPTLTSESASYFEFCTDIAYDYYGEWNINQRLEYLEQLKSLAANGQNLWMVVWNCSLHNPSEETLIKDLEYNYALSLYEERIVGLLGFTYASADDGQWQGDWGLGLNKLKDTMPNLYEKHLQIGKEIIS